MARYYLTSAGYDLLAREVAGDVWDETSPERRRFEGRPLRKQLWFWSAWVDLLDLVHAGFVGDLSERVRSIEGREHVEAQ